MPKTKEYRKPEGGFIARNDIPGLYEAEERLSNAIHECMAIRHKHLKEDEWRVALPEVLFSLLDQFDNQASRLAAEAFLERVAHSK